MSDQTPDIPVEDELPIEQRTIRQESNEKVDCPLCGKVFDIFVVQEFKPVRVEDDGYAFSSERTADMTEIKQHLKDHMDGTLPVNRKERRQQERKNKK